METKQLSVDRPYRPILVGIFWPSTALVMPWEKGPQIAAAPDGDAEAQEYLEMLDEMATHLPDDQVTDFYSLAAEQTLDQGGATKLAIILASLYSKAEDPIENEAEALSAEDLVAYWAEAFPEGSNNIGDDDDFGFAGETFSQPQAAGIFSVLNPRKAIRAATVWKMKDRAGVVGGKGVHELLKDILATKDGHAMHLIGHSYGCKVVLSAACAGSLPRAIESALLLQPAINGYCFSANIAGTGCVGGYRSAFQKIRQPILSTFSKHDQPLTKLFHLAVRRKKDLGEVKIAGGGPPSKYAALGGFGPQGLESEECEQLDILTSSRAYDLDPENTLELYALKGDAHIDGHGGIINEATSWALFCQLRATV